MNIREVEEKTGLTRANIRYYEKEKLLSIERQENGYREYTAENVETLKRIKLLRKLDISMDEIKRLQTDEESLERVLAERLKAAQSEEQRMQEQQKICALMRDDGVTYGSLQADVYLRQFGRINSGLGIQERRSDPVLNDVEIQAPRSWTRFFARWLDLLLYGLLFDCVLYLGLRMMPVRDNALFSLLETAVVLGLMYVLEPMFLHFFGTTPGKWLFGIRVCHVDGDKLSFEDGRRRTGQVIFYGLGLQIPGFSLYRLWKSYWVSENGTEDLPWESYDCVEEIEPLKRKHTIRGIGAYVGCLAAIALLVFYSLSPLHTGKMTAGELAENLNRYHQRDGIYEYAYLDSELHWQEKPQPDGSYSIVIPMGMPSPELSYTEENGYVTSVSIDMYVTGVEAMGHGYQEYIVRLIEAYAGAQPGVNIFDVSKLQQTVMDNQLQDFSVEIAGISMEYEIDYKGYLPVGQGTSDSVAMLWMDGDAKEQYIDVKFTIRPVN